mmetsp:Transcript_66608/g.145994  ORF Transcript_66608/g.145994 Transcript_66608/m.145994 type:complete len:138 (+) Transcript_66608:1509-1922(+)
MCNGCSCWLIYDPQDLESCRFCSGFCRLSLRVISMPRHGEHTAQLCIRTTQVISHHLLDILQNHLGQLFGFKTFLLAFRSARQTYEWSIIVFPFLEWSFQAPMLCNKFTPAATQKALRTANKVLRTRVAPLGSFTNE